MSDAPKTPASADPPKTLEDRVVAMEAEIESLKKRLRRAEIDITCIDTGR